MWSCRLAVWKHSLLCYFVYYYFLYSTLCQIKNFFKRNLTKQPQNKRQVEYCELFDTRSFGGEHLKLFQKQEDYLYSRGDGWIEPSGEISPSDGERQLICKIVGCDIFSPSQKLFAAIKKSVSFHSYFFCGLINLF